MTTQTSARETWLTDFAQRIVEDVFAPAGVSFKDKPFRVSCGWPKASGSKGAHAIGQCWPTCASEGGISETFVSPVLTDPVIIGGVIVHELVHVIDDCEHGHKKEFKALAVRVGLTGKMSATVPTPELEAKLKQIAAELGPYPHKTLNPIKKEKGRRPYVKLECPACGYVVLTTRKWLESDAGAPLCGCGDNGDEIRTFEVVEPGE